MHTFHLADDEFECRDCGRILSDSLDVDSNGRCFDCHVAHAQAERFWRRFRAAEDRQARDAGQQRPSFSNPAAI